MKPFESFLAKHLEEYVAYRHGLGYAKQRITPWLLAFDRYLQKQNINWDQLQPSFFLQLRAEIREHPNTVNEILLDIRGFFRFLVRKGILDQNPLKDIPRLPKRYCVPFVFSQEETQTLIETVCKNIRKKEKYFLLDMAIYVAIVMLAGCGMRINEPLHLHRCHYRKEEGNGLYRENEVQKRPIDPAPQNRIN